MCARSGARVGTWHSGAGALSRSLRPPAAVRFRFGPNERVPHLTASARCASGGGSQRSVQSATRKAPAACQAMHAPPPRARSSRPSMRAAAADTCTTSAPFVATNVAAPLCTNSRRRVCQKGTRACARASKRARERGCEGARARGSECSSPPLMALTCRAHVSTSAAGRQQARRPRNVHQLRARSSHPPALRVQPRARMPTACANRCGRSPDLQAKRALAGAGPPRGAAGGGMWPPTRTCQAAGRAQRAPSAPARPPGRRARRFSRVRTLRAPLPTTTPAHPTPPAPPTHPPHARAHARHRTTLRCTHCGTRAAHGARARVGVAPDPPVHYRARSAHKILRSQHIRTVCQTARVAVGRTRALAAVGAQGPGGAQHCLGDVRARASPRRTARRRRRGRRDGCSGRSGRGVGWGCGRRPM